MLSLEANMQIYLHLLASEVFFQPQISHHFMVNNLHPDCCIHHFMVRNLHLDYCILLTEVKNLQLDYRIQLLLLWWQQWRMFLLPWIHWIHFLTQQSHLVYRGGMAASDNTAWWSFTESIVVFCVYFESQLPGIIWSFYSQKCIYLVSNDLFFM